MIRWIFTLFFILFCTLNLLYLAYDFSQLDSYHLNLPSYEYREIQINFGDDKDVDLSGNIYSIIDNILYFCTLNEIHSDYCVDSLVRQACLELRIDCSELIDGYSLQVLDSKLSSINQTYFSTSGDDDILVNLEETRNYQNLHCIVASVEGEDLSWINNTICKHTIIYRKISIAKQPYYNFSHSFISIPHNLGGETTAFLQFIIENYENLPNNLFFSQANPSEHWIFGTKALNKMLYLCIQYNLSYLPLTNHYALETYNGFNNNKCCHNLTKFVINLLFGDNNNNNNNKVNTSSDYKWQLHAYNGIFFTSKYAIQRRSKSFYYNLLSMMTTGYNNNPDNLFLLHYAIERFWWMILDSYDLNGIFSIDKICKYEFHDVEFLIEICKLYYILPESTHNKIYYNNRISDFDQYYKLVSTLLKVSEILN